MSPYDLCTQLLSLPKDFFPDSCLSEEQSSSPVCLPYLPHLSVLMYQLSPFSKYGARSFPMPHGITNQMHAFLTALSYPRKLSEAPVKTYSTIFSLHQTHIHSHHPSSPSYPIVPQHHPCFSSVDFRVHRKVGPCTGSLQQVTLPPQTPSFSSPIKADRKKEPGLSIV